MNGNALIRTGCKKKWNRTRINIPKKLEMYIALTRLQEVTTDFTKRFGNEMPGTASKLRQSLREMRAKYNGM